MKDLLCHHGMFGEAESSSHMKAKRLAEEALGMEASKGCIFPFNSKLYQLRKTRSAMARCYYSCSIYFAQQFYQAPFTFQGSLALHLCPIVEGHCSVKIRYAFIFIIIYPRFSGITITLWHL